ncbi:MAG TPA: VCBS repeat-containing protein, partial [Thermodesulfovibrionales bacterium]|nr:VCBS repeat-containing protein [Thermodesulfovibrionales bacterium]
LGNLESMVGYLDIREAGTDQSAGLVIQGAAKEGDKIRISEVKVNLLFCQSKDTDWQVADSYHRKLKETDRFNIIDTDLESDNPSAVLNEAKRLKADVVLNLVSKPGSSGTELVQKLFYVSDGIQFSEIKAQVNTATIKDLKFGEEFFKMNKKDVSLEMDLPLDARLITTGDIDGDGKKEIVLSNGKEILFYNLGSDLQPALGGLTIKSSGLDDHLWLDTIDLNGNGRDEVVVTSMKGNEVVSYIYELKGQEFVQLFHDKGFLRRLDKGLIWQAYSRADGYDGPVFPVSLDGTYKKGDALKLPAGVNIYDFVYLDDVNRGKLTVAYDDANYLNIYDSTGLKLWRSKTRTGGFLTSFPRSSPQIGSDRGDWTVKDRLLMNGPQILSVERTPLLKMVKGLGYRDSRIREYRWNGLSAEDSVLIDDISGPVFDYAVSGDTIIVLTGPLFGIKASNIMKGENPMKTELYIYPFKRK